MGTNLRSKVKGQGHWQRKCENCFLLTSSSKVNWFTSIQDQNDQRSILHVSSNTFHQLKCFLWHVSVIILEGSLPTCFESSYMLTESIPIYPFHSLSLALQWLRISKVEVWTKLTEIPAVDWTNCIKNCFFHPETRYITKTGWDSATDMSNVTLI